MSGRKAHNPNVRSKTPEKENPEGAEPEIAQSGALSAQRATSERRRRLTVNWIETLFLLILGALAVLPPIRELHKQLTLAAVAVVQLLEGRAVVWLPRQPTSVLGVRCSGRRWLRPLTAPI